MLHGCRQKVVRTLPKSSHKHGGCLYFWIWGAGFGPLLELIFRINLKRLKKKTENIPEIGPSTLTSQGLLEVILHLNLVKHKRLTERTPDLILVPLGLLRGTRDQETQLDKGTS